MREREIVIRLRLPGAPRKRWLFAGMAALIGASAIAYAAISSFSSGDPLSSTAINNLFNGLDTRLAAIESGYQKPVSPTICPAGQAYNGVTTAGAATCTDTVTSANQLAGAPAARLYPVTAKKSVNNQAITAGGNTAVNAVPGMQVSIQAPVGKGLFLVSWSGETQNLGTGPVSLQLQDVTSAATSGSLAASGNAAGNSVSCNSQQVSDCPSSIFWTEAVNDANSTLHTFLIQSSCGSGVTSATLYGDLTVIWLPQP